MGFRRQMQDRVGRVRRQDPVERGAVADVGMLEGIERVVGDGSDVVEAGGVGQRVEIDHRVAVGHRAADDGGADEAGAAGHEDLHGLSPRR